MRASVTGAAHVRPRSREWLTTVAVNGSSGVTNFALSPAKYTVPAPSADTHGSEAASAVPPVQALSLGIVVRVQVLPASRDDARTSLRVVAGPTSCFQVATML